MLTCLSVNQHKVYLVAGVLMSSLVNSSPKKEVKIK